MKPESTRTLLIAGPEKTGTSSLTKLLNAHPKACILFEVYLHSPILTKYGHQFLNKFPTTRHFFYHSESIEKPFTELFSYLSSSGLSPEYLISGGKINTLETWKLTNSADQKILFSFRDLRSWLVKDSVKKHYRTDLDIVSPTIAYLNALINSFKFKNASIVWLEDFILDHDRTIEKITEYLQIDLSQVKDIWWKHIANDTDDPVKAVFNIDQVHPSSLINPNKLDTHYQLLEIPFWDDVNVIFDKYFKRNTDSNFSDFELDQDLLRVKDLWRHAPLRLDNAYKHYSSERFNNSTATTPKTTSTSNQSDNLYSRILRKFSLSN